MNKIRDYIIVQWETKDEIQEKIKEKIAERYDLFWNLIVNTRATCYHLDNEGIEWEKSVHLYSQAMILTL